MDPQRLKNRHFPSTSTSAYSVSSAFSISVRNASASARSMRSSFDAIEAHRDMMNSSTSLLASCRAIHLPPALLVRVRNVLDKGHPLGSLAMAQRIHACNQAPFGSNRSPRFPPIRLAGCNSGLGSHDCFLLVSGMIKPCPRSLASPRPTIEQVSLTKTIYKTVRFFAQNSRFVPEIPEVASGCAGCNDGGK